MPKGYTGVILRINLSEEKIEKINMPESFYRLYMGGSAFGGYFLLNETSGDIDAFDESNILNIAQGVTTGAEVSGGSYARKIASFGTPSNGASSTDADIQFDQATGNWGTITHFGIYDSLSGGNLLYHGALTVSKLIETGDVFKIASGNLTVTLA